MIRQTYAPKLKEAKTPEESNQIRDEAISKMKEAITQQTAGRLEIKCIAAAIFFRF
jgi:TRAP-type C4-dicarboxylate transport system substrate-binding protein